MSLLEYPSDAIDESLAGHEKNALWSLCGYWRVGILIKAAQPEHNSAEVI